MPHIEVIPGGGMKMVSSHKSKKHGSRKARTETVYVVDEETENQYLNDIDHLKSVIAQLREVNKTLERDARDSEKVAKASAKSAKEWKAESLDYKEKYLQTDAGKALLEERVARRDEILLNKNRDIETLLSNQEKLKGKVGDLEVEKAKRGDTITVLKDDKRLLKDENIRLENRVRDLKDDLDRALRRGDIPQRRPFDNDWNEHWDRVGPLPRREHRGGWGARS